MDPDGANAKQVTNLSTEADGELFSPDGKNLVFTSEVYPECGADDACNRRTSTPKRTARSKRAIYTELLYRHWTPWQSRAAQPSAGGSGSGRTRPATSRRATRDVPPFSLGGPDDYAISPDGQEVCYSHERRPGAGRQHQRRSVRGPDQRRRGAQDHPHARRRYQPQYSPDGKYIAWRAQFRAGYESDRWRLMVLERATGKLTNLTETLDRWVNSFTWSPDSRTSVLHRRTTAAGRPSSSIAVKGGATRIAVSGDSDLDDMQFTRDGKTMVYTAAERRRAGRRSIARLPRGGAPVALTHLNDAVLNAHQLTPLEEFWVDSAGRRARAEFRGEAATAFRRAASIRC